ncbi:MAG: COG2426 family protein [Desulfurococcales archaeon]|nr:COG2426 family protein [Desulfurococcales archaeon]
MQWSSEVNPYIYILLMSLAPGFEGRYAVVTARALGLDAGHSIFVASLGVIILSFLLPRALPLADIVAESLIRRGWGPLARIASLYLSYAERARNRARPVVERYGFLGLVVFVMIPLPLTGVWTGAIAAYLLGMRPWKAALALAVGGLLSIGIMSASFLH